MGRGADCKDAIMLTLGTGVGGAVMVNGQILRGTGGIAGHIGHLRWTRMDRNVSAATAVVWRLSSRHWRSRVKARQWFIGGW